LIEKHRVLYTGVVPTMMVYLMNHPARAQHDLSSLARVTSGGAPLAEQVRSDFIRVFNCRVDQGYGLSETMAVVSGYAEQDSYRPGSAGRPAPGVEVRVEEGEICVGGEHVMRGTGAMRRRRRLSCRGRGCERATSGIWTTTASCTSPTGRRT
jgi:long-chain acyl-CoA synthetase